MLPAVVLPYFYHFGVFIQSETRLDCFALQDIRKG